jgi:hypothetical protein
MWPQWGACELTDGGTVCAAARAAPPRPPTTPNVLVLRYPTACCGELHSREGLNNSLLRSDAVQNIVNLADCHPEF